MIGVDGCFTPSPCHISAYIDTPAPTTVVADTWTPLAGSFVNSQIDGFELEEDAIIAKCTDDTLFKLSFSGAIEHTSVGAEMSIGIYKNGVLYNESVMSTFAKTKDEFYNLSSNFLIKLDNNDTIRIETKASITGTLTAGHFNTSLHAI